MFYKTTNFTNYTNSFLSYSDWMVATLKIIRKLIQKIIRTAIGRTF